MPLNSSGPISIGGSTTGQSINLELSRSATAESSLNESALRTLAGKATGAISLSDFYGKSNVLISISDQNLVDFSYGTAYSYYFLNSNGTISSFRSSAGIVTIGQWCTPTSAAANYEARVTVITGSLSGGDVGVWQFLANTRTWHVSQDVAYNSTYCAFLVEIRREGTETVLDSAVIELGAEKLGFD